MAAGRYDRMERESRSKWISVTVTPSDDARIREAAERAGLSISSFVARAASIAAMDALGQPAVEV